jgi:hypothetical protein
MLDSSSAFTTFSINPNDFPPLHPQDERQKTDTPIETPWSEVAKQYPSTNKHYATTTNLPEQSYADAAGHETHVQETNPTPIGQVKRKLLNKNAPGKSIIFFSLWLQYQYLFIF